MFINELQSGAAVQSDFMIAQHNVKLAKNGKQYQFIKLQDRTGQIDAFNWNYQDGHHLFQDGDVATVKGSVVEFKGNLQISIANIIPSGAAFDRARFLPSTKYNIDELFARLEKVIGKISDSHLKKLLVTVAFDPEIHAKLLVAPAAKGMHHAYIGGLLEHMVSVMELAHRVCPHYPHVNQDMVLAGAFFHDLGKIYELEYDTAFGYTTPGMLLGHLYIGCEIVERFTHRIHNFPDKLALELKHIILAHHGELEYGSPKRPKTYEALIVHHLDDLDAKLQVIEASFTGIEGEWSDMHRLMGRRFYRPSTSTPPKETPVALKSEPPLQKTLPKADTFGINPFKQIEGVLPFETEEEVPRE